jgi:hypothetical protein
MSERQSLLLFKHSLGCHWPSADVRCRLIYAQFQWYWLLGALLPLLFYVLIRLFPRSPIRMLNAPVMLGAMAWLPPATPLSFSTWVMFGLLFNYWIHRRWGGWWHTYNYVTSAALDSGLIISTIVIFFAISMSNATIPQWWGNVGIYNTMVSTFILRDSKSVVSHLGAV